MRKIGLWLIASIGVLLLTGILFEQYSRWRLEKDIYEGKTFAEIDEHKIHYVKKGEGNKTVVFVSGLGSNNTIWQETQDSIAKNAVTISYDRSGLFLSDKSEAPITNDAASKELARLLEKTNCHKPYIIVAHSMAGIYMRPFITSHAKDITGIVFVEAAHPLQMKKASPQLLKAISAPPMWLIRFVVNTGIYRTLFSFVQLNPELSIDHPMHIHERNFFYKSYETLIKEAENDDRNFKDAEKYNSFGDIPLTDIVGTSDIRSAFFKDPNLKKEYRDLVYEIHADLLNLSTNSRSVKATKSGHVVQINDSDLITGEIRKLLFTY